MMNDILIALQAVATFENLLIMVAGIWGGVIIGAIPGMTGTMAVTLALPFTFYMAPVPSILLLVALYKGSTYGGSVSAILIKTPGTASAACTALDGYPLAQQGKAGKALNMALYSSVTGDFISNLSLIFLAAPLAMLALHVGPPEYFMLMLFALTTVAGVSGNSLLLGLVSAAMGLLLATAGEDMYGSFRFAFTDDMQAGLSVAPVLIGLFALPELIKMIVMRAAPDQETAKLGDQKVSRAEFLSSLKSILRGSSIGVIMGAIPGIGPSAAAFFSYGEAQRSLKNGKNFGKGELEGIAASESANNGACGATMIPLLALGVPGDVITGVMLGAFMIQGLTPGPLLFQTNMHEIYMLFIGMLFSSVLLFGAGKLTMRMFSYVAHIPQTLLTPAVLLLCLFGIYSISSSMFDVTVLLVMGCVGFAMFLLNIPAAPFLIAFILGPMIEENLRRALALSRGEPGILLSSPITWVFAALIVFVVGLTVRREIQKSKERKALIS
ncbi:tripartite tricarboxylate transporter permease [Phaeobacter gallaeciensis]|uniref:tripartite tricarboxylate transporter permease n=1 Tax=Phaeobacter gallaeciensis TaxID=60890 RepID=UPI00237EF99C|nr:tripartite tricarboxylate transporter permease [Phaeobacter gallaeciensis]MDE4140720.1 tripartite tricarboxylate transporter permease [Phaeobacter gallaeciensis]MDE4149165.1 tripartite tricarboxylate transporter permease [Phaeobacter gallaeciensis]MDE4153642.1 tripartite tricarboxylate transporter permease [Phaeobacter gallaeciensis]MDE4229032.1 tripartite tricarboxylate transporter permease [Phaeobacter gallaeciensis]MDE4258107.1 tripartite tricarboxylate transporter permease [Phaeobacter 